MNDLRKAAEALLNHWEAGEYKNCTGFMAGHVRVLREAAAQPEWVGLTDEEIKKIAKKHKWHDGNVEPHLMPVFRSLEAKLKEKNT